MTEVTGLIETHETYEAIRKYCNECVEKGIQTTVGEFLVVANNMGLKTKWRRPFKHPRGMGSAISAAWRYTQKNYGDEAADNIAETFIDPRTGELVWKKYHD